MKLSTYHILLISCSVHKTGLVQGGISWTSGARRKVMNQTEIESPNIVFFHDSIYTVFGRLWPKKNAALGQEGSKQCFWAGNTVLHGIKCKCAKNQCICRKLAKTRSFMLDKRLPPCVALICWPKLNQTIYLQQYLWNSDRENQF